MSNEKYIICLNYFNDVKSPFLLINFENSCAKPVGIPKILPINIVRSNVKNFRITIGELQYFAYCEIIGGVDDNFTFTSGANASFSVESQTFTSQFNNIIYLRYIIRANIVSNSDFVNSTPILSLEGDYYIIVIEFPASSSIATDTFGVGVQFNRKKGPSSTTY